MQRRATMSANVTDYETSSHIQRGISRFELERSITRSGKSGIEALRSLVHERQTLTPGWRKLRAGVVIALIPRASRAYFKEVCGRGQPPALALPASPASRLVESALTEREESPHVCWTCLCGVRFDCPAAEQ